MRMLKLYLGGGVGGTHALPGESVFGTGRGAGAGRDGFGGRLCGRWGGC